MACEILNFLIVMGDSLYTTTPYVRACLCLLLRLSTRFAPIFAQVFAVMFALVFSFVSAPAVAYIYAIACAVILAFTTSWMHHRQPPS